MSRFVYDAESYQLPLPELFKEHFSVLLPHHSPVSEVHQHQTGHCAVSDISHFVTLPSASKFKMLDHDETYNKTATYCKQHLGSLKYPSTANSSFVMASWVDSTGCINEDSIPRPGRVLFYFLHQFNDKKHLFAAVYWYMDHSCHSLYGKPLEVWRDSHIPEGPSMFLPIHKLLCRCTSVHAMIPLPDNKEERVVYITPLPAYMNYSIAN